MWIEATATNPVRGAVLDDLQIGCSRGSARPALGVKEEAADGDRHNYVPCGIITVVCSSHI